MTATKRCPDCCVYPGALHKEFCDVEPCRECGGQLLTCGCTINEAERLPWTGEWPGIEECREFGWYLKVVLGKGSVECAKDANGAREDLNRLGRDAVWSKEQGRFIR